MTAEAKSRCVRLSQVHSASGQTPVRDVLLERDVQPHQEEQLHHPLGELHTHAPPRSDSLVTPVSDPKLVITRPLRPPPPQHVNPAASSLIKRMLHADPSQRPTIAELQADEFFTSGYVPTRLPTTCLTIPPRFSMGPSTAMELNQRRPLTAINNKGNGKEKKKQLLIEGRAAGVLGFFLRVSCVFETLNDIISLIRNREGGCERRASAKVRKLLPLRPSRK